MRFVSRMRSLFGACLAFAAYVAIDLALAGCGMAHGRPGPGPDVPRPEEELHFTALYKENCAGCHGENGRDGAAISLANPIYIAFAREHLNGIVANGVPGHLMPAFGKGAGGMLTDKQIAVLTQGMIDRWGSAALHPGQTIPPYAATLKPDLVHGQQAYSTFCARCHGANGEGGTAEKESSATPTGSRKPGSIVDGSFLALMSDQNLRSVTVAGRPDQGMPDWQNDAAQPMSDQQVTDIVAWIASKRVANPGQPYPQR